MKKLLLILLFMQALTTQSKDFTKLDSTKYEFTLGQGHELFMYIERYKPKRYRIAIIPNLPCKCISGHGKLEITFSDGTVVKTFNDLEYNCVPLFVLFLQDRAGRILIDQFLSLEVEKLKLYGKKETVEVVLSDYERESLRDVFSSLDKLSLPSRFF